MSVNHKKHIITPSLTDAFARFLMLTVGALLGALAVILFLVPSGIAPGGLSGIAIILNYLIGTPVGLVTLVLNVPVLILGYYMLGGWRVVIWTVYFTVMFSLLIDLLAPFLPADGVSQNHLLNAIFSGIFSGISGGIAFRAGATGGGTTVLLRILNMRYGIPTSSSTLYIDGAIVVVSGLVFGWESAMFAILSLVVYGMTADYVLEGASVIRTVTIITNKPQDLSEAILYTLNRGATMWTGQGAYTGTTRHILFVTVLRSQVTTLRDVIVTVDPEAFVIVGQGHIAFGEGFKKLPRPGSNGNGHPVNGHKSVSSPPAA